MFVARSWCALRHENKIVGGSSLTDGGDEKLVEFALTTGAFGKDVNGDAVTGLTYDFSDISYSVGDTGSSNIGGYIGEEDDPYAAFGLNISGTFEFEVGLTGAAHVDLGHLDTTLEIGTEDFVVIGARRGGDAGDVGLHGRHL